jgi:hypothetical protein
LPRLQVGGAKTRIKVVIFAAPTVKLIGESVDRLELFRGNGKDTANNFLPNANNHNSEV